VEWIKLEAVGPWGLTLAMAASILVAFLRDGLVSGASVRRADERMQAEMARLCSQWETRLAESAAREEAWRAVAIRSDERADVASQQVAELIHSLRIIEGCVLRHSTLTEEGL
jgi:hypothetical protein